MMFSGGYFGSNVSKDISLFLLFYFEPLSS